MAINTYATLQTAVANWLERDDLTSRIPEFIALAENRIAHEVRCRAMETTITLVLKKAVSVTAAELTGTNDLIMTPSTAATSYALGDNYSFTAEATNTGAMTVNVSGLGETAIKKGSGSDALVAGDVINTATYNLRYDGTNFILQEQVGIVPLPSNFLELRRMELTVANSPSLNYSPPQDFWLRGFSDEAGQPTDFTIEGDNIIFRPAPASTYAARLLYYRKFTAFSADSDTSWLLTNATGLYLYGALIEASPYIEDDLRALTWATMWDNEVDKLHKRDRRDRFPGGSLVMKSQVFGV